MRQLGWLHSVPDGQKTKVSRTRWELSKANKEDPELPDPGRLGFLADWVFEIGPALPAMSGAAPLTYSEIVAWQAATGTVLEFGEAQLLRQLSQAYCSELQAGKTNNTPPVLRDSRDKAKLAQGIFAALRARSA